MHVFIVRTIATNKIIMVTTSLKRAESFGSMVTVTQCPVEFPNSQDICPVCKGTQEGDAIIDHMALGDGRHRCRACCIG